MRQSHSPGHSPNHHITSASALLTFWPGRFPFMGGGPAHCEMSSSTLASTTRHQQISLAPAVPTQCLCAVLSRSVMSDLCDPMDCGPPDSSVHGDSPGKNNGVGGHALLQWIFPTQGSNPGLSHCRWILYHLSYKESPLPSEPQGKFSVSGHCQMFPEQ